MIVVCHGCGGPIRRVVFVERAGALTFCSEECGLAWLRVFDEMLDGMADGLLDMVVDRSSEN